MFASAVQGMGIGMAVTIYGGIIRLDNARYFILILSGLKHLVLLMCLVNNVSAQVKTFILL